MKLLLTSVFGPFGVDDEFGRKENIMELFHNQVTREQGVFSLRFNHESFGLHLMAENISVPTIVLDFPSRQRFIQELKKGYDYIGISFIVPNFVKAKEMARLIREHSPKTKIILGGHGTSIPDVEKLIESDHVCRGDGVHFLRSLFGQDVNAPINHPIRHSVFNRWVMGAPVGDKGAGILMTGVGCVNACRFCCTTHYFQKQYTSFLKTGQEIFDVCLKMEKQLGVKEFFIMDENFLKNEQRARELVDLMEKHGKAWGFSIFSSAETIARMGIDFMQRLGVEFIWVGVESKKETYEKNKGIDFPKLIREMRDAGMMVLASGILFSEHHDKKTIHEDIDFMISLNAVFVQFMQLGPLPGTKLFNDYIRKGKLRLDIPYEEWHGQHQLWFTHPHFTGEESEQYLREAFRREYEANGPSILRFADSAIRGVYNTAKSTDAFIKLRHEKRTQAAMELYPLVDAMVTHAPNKKAKQLARHVREQYDGFFGKRSLKIRTLNLLVQGLIIKEKIREKVVQNNMRQPYTIQTGYRMALEPVLSSAAFKGKVQDHILNIQLAIEKLPVHLDLSGKLDTRNIRELQSALVAYLKKESKGITLDLTHLKHVEAEALRKLCRKLEKYRGRINLVYEQSVADPVREVIESLKLEFHNLNVSAVPAR